MCRSSSHKAHAKAGKCQYYTDPEKEEGHTKWKQSRRRRGEKAQRQERCSFPETHHHVTSSGMLQTLICFQLSGLVAPLT